MKANFPKAFFALTLQALRPFSSFVNFHFEYERGPPMTARVFYLKKQQSNNNSNRSGRLSLSEPS